MFDLVGHHFHNVDEKGRIFLPAGFRKAVAEGLVVTIGSGPFLIVFPPSKWEEMAETLSKIPVYTQPRLAALRRKITSNAKITNLDSQGRLTLPDHLLVHASISTKIVVSGSGDYIELWNPDLWAVAKVESDSIVIEAELEDIPGV
jgi:MraZ protein